MGPVVAGQQVPKGRGLFLCSWRGRPRVCSVRPTGGIWVRPPAPTRPTCGPRRTSSARRSARRGGLGRGPAKEAGSDSSQAWGPPEGSDLLGWLAGGFQGVVFVESWSLTPNHADELGCRHQAMARLLKPCWHHSLWSKAFLHHGRCDKPHCRYAHSVEELRVAPGARTRPCLGRRKRFRISTPERKA